MTWLSTPTAISPFTSLSCFVAGCKYNLNHLTTGLESEEHKPADDALSRLQGINAPRCPTATPSVHPWPRIARQPQVTWLNNLGTCISPRATQNLDARDSSPGAKVPLLGTTGSDKRGTLACWAPVWKVPGSWGMRTAQRGLELMEPCAHSRRAAENKGSRAFSHPRPARVRWLCLVLTVWVRDAGGARGRWARVNRSPPAHSKRLPPIPHLVPQSSCYGIPGRLPWVTQLRKREHAWDDRSLRAAEPSPTGVGAEL